MFDKPRGNFKEGDEKYYRIFKENRRGADKGNRRWYFPSRQEMALTGNPGDFIRGKEYHENN